MILTPSAALIVIGATVALKFGFRILHTLYEYFLRPSKNLPKLGKYAVVTGATDGIGKAYAFALAQRGMSLILISRTEAKLKQVAQDIDETNNKSKRQVEKTKYIVCDYSNFDETTRQLVAKDLHGLDIGILINNVGQSYRYPRFFHELPTNEVDEIIEMNIHSTVFMTKIILDGMLSRQRGTIVNLSSASAEYTMPLLAEYAAAKIFVERFSQSLDAEYREKGITMQCQIPFYVATKLAKMRKSVMVPTAEEYVQMSMRWIGYSGVVSPYWLHALQGWLMANLPDFILETMVRNMHLGIRKKGKKKDEMLSAEGKKE